MAERHDPGRCDHRPARRNRARLVALFLLGAALFNPPLLWAFDTPATLFGWPTLLVWLLVAWALLVAAMALIVERRPR